MDDRERGNRFPRSEKYDIAWVSAGGMGSNPLWLTEWLSERLRLEPGMRVLDLGCGYARSSVFLAKEFGVQVWATDLWVPATDNWKTVSDQGLANQVYPLHCDARSLPFAAEFFDAIVAVDCYPYFGTDDLYLNYLIHFLKPSGQIGIAGAGILAEMTTSIPEHLRKFWTQDLWAIHSVDWWRRLWQRTGLVEIECAETMEDGWKLWTQWHRHIAPFNTAEIETIETDAGRNLGYIRLVGRRLPNQELAEYAWPDTLKTMLQDARRQTDKPQNGV